MTYRTDNNKVRGYVKGYGFMSFAKNLGSKYGKKIINNFKKKKKKLYGPFLWMGFNCLKARATSRRQFTFYH